MEINFLITKSNCILGLDKETWDFYKSKKIPGYRIASADEVQEFGTKEQKKAFKVQNKDAEVEIADENPVSDPILEPQIET